MSAENLTNDSKRLKILKPTKCFDLSPKCKPKATPLHTDPKRSYDIRHRSNHSNDCERSDSRIKGRSRRVVTRAQGRDSAGHRASAVRNLGGLLSRPDRSTARVGRGGGRKKSYRQAGNTRGVWKTVVDSWYVAPAPGLRVRGRRRKLAESAYRVRRRTDRPVSRRENGTPVCVRRRSRPKTRIGAIRFSGTAKACVRL